MDADIPVTCRTCGTRMYAFAHQAGHSVLCPDCDTANRVPLPSNKPSKANSKSNDNNGGDFRLMDEGAWGKQSNQPQTVTLTCTVCHTLLTVKASQAGKQVRCPDCSTLNRIPRPRVTEKTKVQLSETDDLGFLAEPEGNDVATDVRKEIANRLLSEAKESIERVDEVKQKAGYVSDESEPLDGLFRF